MIDPLWHGANGIHYTFENNAITIPLVSKETTNRFIYEDQDNRVVYIANLTGRTDAYPSHTTTNQDGIVMPIGVPNLNMKSDSDLPDILKLYNYSSDFKGIKSARFTGSTHLIRVKLKSGKLPQLKSFKVNYVNAKDQKLGQATFPVYSDTINLIKDRNSNITGQDDTSKNLAATVSNLGGLPKIDGIPYTVNDSDVINKLNDQNQPYSVDLNVVKAQILDHIRFIGDDADDKDVKGVVTTQGHVDAPAGYYFVKNNPDTQQLLANNNGNFTFDGQTHTFYVAPISKLIIPIIFYQNGDRNDVVASTPNALSGKTGHQVQVYYQYVQNHLPNNYRIASDGNQIINALDNYTVGTNLDSQTGQYGLYGGGVNLKTQRTSQPAVEPLYIPVTNLAKLTFQYKDVSHGRNRMLPISDDSVDGSRAMKYQLLDSDLQLSQLKAKTGTIYRLQDGYLPPEVSNLNQLVTVPVLPVPDKIQFTLSGKNLPQGYAGKLYFSDNSDYDGAGHRSAYSFSNDQTSANGIKGLPAHYHVVSNQTIPYDGATHQVQIAPDQEKGVVNYVYTDQKGRPHTLKSAPISGGYNVQFRINTRPGISDEANPNAILNQMDRFTMPNNQTYQLVHQQSNGNQLTFKDGQLLHTGQIEQDDPSQPNYNPSNNVINVPVDPVGIGKIHINYLNEIGHQLASDVFSGNDDSDLNSATEYTNVSGHHKVSPGNHIVSDNPDPDDYQINSSALVNSDYTFKPNQQYVTVPLIGKTDDSSDNHSQHAGNDTVTINLYTADQNGNHRSRQPVKVLHQTIAGRIGSNVTLQPSDYLNDLPGKNQTRSYTVDPQNNSQGFYLQGSRSDQNGSATLWSVNSLGQPQQKLGSKAQVSFTYDASSNYSSDVQPITVQYINQNHQQVGTTDTITPTNSDYGQKIDVADVNSKMNNKPGYTAQGENVPVGYHLAGNLNTNYWVTNTQQNVTLQVQGNQIQVNNLPIKLVAHVDQSDGKTTDTTTQDQLSDGQGHDTPFKASVSYTIKPQLTGRVGDSDVLNAVAYQSRIKINSKQTITSTGTNEYHIHFNANGATVTDPSANGTVFNYQITDQPQTRQRNYIHYISYSDINNRGDITTQPNHQDFPTKVSDASDAGSTFNDQYYRENVPTGYQFYKVYSVNGNKTDSQISGGLKQFGDGNGTPGEEYIEVIPNASPITFHYINQNGSDVKDVQLSGNGSKKNAIGNVTNNGNKDSKISDYTSNFGKQITSKQINQAGQPDDKLGVPQGYQYNALTSSQGQPSTIGESQPVFSRNPQDVYIPVIGTTYKRVNLKFQQDLSDANHHHTFNLVSDHISDAQVGRNYSFYGFNLATPSTGTKDGYTLDYNGHPFKVTVHINPDHSYSFVNPSDNAGGQADTYNDQNGSIKDISVNQVSDIKNNNKIYFDNNGNTTNPPEVNFWYHVTDNISKPLTLIYINQAGQQVGCVGKLQGTIGSDVNVTDPAKGGEPVPDNYQLDPNQTTQYRFTDQPRTVYLHVQGQSVITKIVVYTVAQNSDGTVTFGHQVRSVSGANGSLVSVDPANYYPDEVNDPKKDGSKSKYSIDYSKDSEQFVRLTRNQNGQTVAAPKRIIFYYTHRTTDGAPITLRYINDRNGQEVGYPKVINGNLSDTVAVDHPNAQGKTLAGESVPAGYQIDASQLATDNLVGGKSQHPVYQFSASPQMLNIPVTGNQKTLTYHIHVFKESSDGTIQGPASDVALHITGNIGDTIHINPYGFNQGSDITSISDNNSQTNSYGIPQGYHATNLDLDRDIQINANGQLSPDSNTNYFYRRNYQAQQVGTVRIHYITDSVNSLKSNGVGSDGIPKDHSEVDEVSDKGIAGNAKDNYQGAGSFDLAPYRDDIPEELSANYQSTGIAMDQNGTQINGGNVPIDQGGNRWHYSENDNNFSNGIRDVYIQVKQRDNGPIIINYLT